LIYADPIYPGFGDKLYDMSFSPRDHEELLEDLRNCGEQVVLSGYDDLIPLLPDWHAVRKATRNRKRALRTEVLMLNPLAWENLNAGKI
jgi:site-specific DNA-adenine methylase